MDISYIKSLSNKNRIKNISEINGIIRLDLVSTENMSLELIHELSKDYGRSISFDLSAKPYLNFKPKKKMS